MKPMQFQGRWVLVTGASSGLGKAMAEVLARDYHANVIAVALAPIDTSQGLPGTYRVTAVGAPSPGPVGGALLGLGPAAQALAPPPNVGDTVALAFDTAPPASSLAAAVGGGPLLVANGATVDDPNSPATEEEYFGLHRDLSAAQIAHQLDGDLVWQTSDGLQWAAVLRFHRAVEANLQVK